MWKEREMKNWHKESRCPESGGEKEARKNENGMGGLREERSGKSGRRMENNSKRQKELENAVREKCGEERKDKEKPTSPLRTGTTKVEQLNVSIKVYFFP